MIEELKDKKLLFQDDKLFKKYFSERKETEFEKSKYEELYNMISTFYKKVYGDDNYKYFLIDYLSIGYLEDYGYYATTDADRGYRNIINLGGKLEDAFVNLVGDALFTYAIVFEWTNRRELVRDYISRFGNTEYNQSLSFAEYALNQWSKYYDGNIPNNIIKLYEEYLNSILLDDKGKRNWIFDIEQGLFTYKDNKDKKVRELKANN